MTKFFSLLLRYCDFQSRHLSFVFNDNLAKAYTKIGTNNNDNYTRVDMTASDIISEDSCNHDDDSRQQQTKQHVSQTPTMLLFLQWTLLVFNFILMWVGVWILTNGIWFGVDAHSFLSVMFNVQPPSNMQSLQSLCKSIAICTIIIGGVSTMAGLFGGFSAVRDHQAIQALYYTLMALVCGLLIAVGIAGRTEHESSKRSIAGVMTMETEAKQPNGLLAWSSQRFNCCGIGINSDITFEDLLFEGDSGAVAPETEPGTCTETFPGVNCTEGSKRCSVGCLEEFWLHIAHPAIITMSTTSFVFGAVLVCSVVLSLVTCCKRHF